MVQGLEVQWKTQHSAHAQGTDRVGEAEEKRELQRASSSCSDGTARGA